MAARIILLKTNTVKNLTFIEQLIHFTVENCNVQSRKL